MSEVGRLAPSPTGLLHLGHARTFLAAWWRARGLGGSVRLRIDDLDQERSKPELASAALRDLEWLGLDWEGPVEIQSEGLERLTEAALGLLRAGLAYPCTCTRGDILTAQAAPHGRVPRYPGTCRGRYGSLAEAERAAGRRAGIRLKVEDGPVRLSDGLLGPCELDVQAEVGDFLIARRVGAPAYQLAAIVDDVRIGVTEVVRGDDLLPSAARQKLVAEALGLVCPRFFHVPLVTDPSGQRLAKRHDAMSLAELRAHGVDPRAIVGWAARSLGQPAKGRVTPLELVQSFDGSRIPRAPWVLTGRELEEFGASG